MGILLSDADLRQLREAQDVLLSPLQAEDLEGWGRRANRAVGRVLGSDHACLAWPDRSLGIRIVTEDTDPAFERGLRACAASAQARARYEDRFLERVHRRRLRRGSGSYHLEDLTGRKERAHSASYQEVFVPAGFEHLVALSTRTESGAVTQFFGFEDGDSGGYAREGMERLHLLEAAFSTSVRMRQNVGCREEAVLDLLDELPHPAVLFGPDGAPLHRNRAFAALLAEDPAAARLPEAADRLAAGAARRREAPRKADGRPALARPSATVGGYRLSISRLSPRSGCPDAILVVVEREGSSLPPVEEIVRIFGLTEREAQVARLMARGESDKAVAARLSIRHGTARKHAERVLKKLDLRSRAAVALTLLNGSRPGSG